MNKNEVFLNSIVNKWIDWSTGLSVLGSGLDIDLVTEIKFGSWICYKINTSTSSDRGSKYIIPTNDLYLPLSDMRLIVALCYKPIR